MENISIKFSNNNYESKRVNMDFYSKRIKNISYKSNFIESQKEEKQTSYIIRKDSRVFDE